MHIEQIIESVGGMSRFQLITLPLTIGTLAVVSWSMLMMSFAGVSPDWWCIPEEVTGDEYLNNRTLELCPPADNATCKFVYSQDKKTIVSEWDLICRDSTRPSLTTSIQMFGVLIGAFLGGQSADMLGRKPTLYLSLILQSVINLAAAFSVSWQMFTALRFFIGMTIGSLLVVHCTYYMEFVSPKWRPLCGAAPTWMMGVAVMALSSWLLPNWSYQHIILAAVHLPFILGLFIVPESPRWLAVKGRLDDAEKVVDLMCRYNKREKPGNTRMLLKRVSEEEANQKKYTYVDIFRGRDLWWRTLIIMFIWACMALVYYGIAFGAGKLSGNLYLNIFLLNTVSIPAVTSTFFLNNKIGRRWSCFLFFTVSAVSALGVIITSRLGTGDLKGTIITTLAIFSQLGVSGAWSSVQLISCEIYPTVIRNLGYGAANTAARIGGITAPYIFISGGEDVMIPFIIVGSAMGICAVLSLVMRETLGTPLEDTVEIRDTPKAEKNTGTVISIRKV